MSVEDLGIIALKGDTLEFSSENRGQWAISVGDIAVVAEYTTSDGPYLPDYFWVLVQRSGEWHIAPMDAEDEGGPMESLEARLGGDWKYGLCGCTELASNIVWPSDLAGAALFTFTPLPLTGWRKILRFLGPEYKIGLTDTVRTYLEALPPA